MISTVPEFGITRVNEERRDGGCGVIFDPNTQKYAVGRRVSDGLLILFSGGTEPGEDIQSAVLREVREESGLYDFAHVEKANEALAHYFNRSKHVARVAHATCFLIVLKSTDVVPTKQEAHEQFELEWKTPAEILANWHDHNGDHGLDHWIYFLNTAVGRCRNLGYDKSQG